MILKLNESITINKLIHYKRPGDRLFKADGYSWCSFLRVYLLNILEVPLNFRFVLKVMKVAEHDRRPAGL